MCRAKLPKKEKENFIGFPCVVPKTVIKAVVDIFVDRGSVRGPHARTVCMDYTLDCQSLEPSGCYWLLIACLLHSWTALGWVYHTFGPRSRASSGSRLFGSPVHMCEAFLGSYFICHWFVIDFLDLIQIQIFSWDLIKYSNDPCPPPNKNNLCHAIFPIVGLLWYIYNPCFMNDIYHALSKPLGLTWYNAPELVIGYIFSHKKLWLW